MGNGANPPISPLPNPRWFVGSDRCWVTGQVRPLLGPPARCPFPVSSLGERSPAKIDKTEKTSGTNLFLGSPVKKPTEKLGTNLFLTPQIWRRLGDRSGAMTSCAWGPRSSACGAAGSSGWRLGCHVFGG